MDLAGFHKSLKQSSPPANASPLVAALWWDARGDWGRAHVLAQDVEGSDGAWVHAYLHRREGDLANAAYWYRQAGQPISSAAYEVERDTIVQDLMARPGTRKSRPERRLSE